MTMLMLGLVLGLPLLRLVGMCIGFAVSFGATLLALSARFIVRRVVTECRHRRMLRA